MENTSGDAFSMEIMDDHAVIHSLDSDHDTTASMTALGTMEDETDAFEEEPSFSHNRFQSKRFEESKSDHGDSTAAPASHYKNRYSYASVVKDRGINIDLTQPWQRSMLLQLEKLDHGLEVRPERKPELMVLGHAESRDFAYAVEKDDITLATAASSSCPTTKDQTIYRLDSTENMSAGNAHCLPQNFARHERQRSRSRYSHRTNEHPAEEKCQAEFPLYDCGVAPHDTMETQQRPYSRMMVNPRRGTGNNGTMMSERRPENMSDRHDRRPPTTDNSFSEENDPSTGAQEACFCLGYNILDYWIPPGPRRSEQFRSSQKRPRQLRHMDEVNNADTKQVPNVKPPSRSGQIHHRDPSGSYAFQPFEDRDDLLMR
ncbi:hypothetical protein FisN_23Hh139 [Fistulifera solaris]|jgi:hypothetical protein|uniref:Uncharacterized protein n=1 Tax=Fistulifera solaris TaxID=1519565 RepID=A0A1Z5KMW6_FISSO|nr:hypothetical protein FisN_23Hh139 [Fistulifera solaris]|eukprot:GAX27402.1 hypothetical protein FisN_23Hh139 [Fistulifera solaris]